MSQELPDGVELPSYTAMKTAAMILSDCGHSTNNTQLHERVARRVDAHSDAHAAAILADREKQAARVPDGWKLVPIKPTPEMIDAMRQFIKWGWSETENGRRPMSMLYAELLAAAPTTEPSKADQADAPSDAELNELAQQHTWFNGSHAMTNYPGFARAAIARWGATQPPASNAGEREPVTQDEHVSVQQAWEWAGGNPGIKATPDMLREVLRNLIRAALATKPQAGDVAQDKIDAERWRAARGEFCNTVWCAIGAGESGKGLDDFLDEAIAARAARTRGEGGGT